MMFIETAVKNYVMECFFEIEEAESIQEMCGGRKAPKKVSLFNPVCAERNRTNLGE